MNTRQLVPLLAVANVERSIEFYSHLGFEAWNTFARDDSAKPLWASLQSGDAQLMLGAASEPEVTNKPAVLFYIYTDDVVAAHESLAKVGPTGTS
jgi:predicted enzyme related to lactoylglutathione lyase